MNNKNKNLIIIILSIVVIILAIGMGITGFIKSLDKTSNTSDNINNEIKEDDLEIKKQESLDSFYNNYLITYFLENDIEVNNEDFIINNSNTYYLVTDDIVNNLLKDIHSEKDFNNLLEKTFNDETIINKIKNYMKSNYSNSYLNKDGKLYVKKGLETCNVNNGVKLEKSNLYISNPGDIDYVIYGRSQDESPKVYPLPRDENGKIIVSYLWFNCVKNFNLK